MEKKSTLLYFNTTLSEMSTQPSLFSVSPETDFSRNRSFTFEKTMKCILGMAGNSLNKEIYDFCQRSSVSATASAFVQQRAKILPFAFEYLFFEQLMIQDRAFKPDTYKGYRLFAIDGTDVNIAYNPDDTDTYIANGSNKGFNQLHINAMYDVLNHIYMDAVVQPKRRANEVGAACQMVDRSRNLAKNIVICDRGYESFNLFEHCNRKDNTDFLIRVKNHGLKEVRNLPMSDMDIVMPVNIRTTQTINDILDFKRGRAHYLSGYSRFGKYKKSKTWDYEPDCTMNIRIVRFKISDDTYETIVTSLNRFEFPADSIKELYHMRWGVETSFRELKYALGLVNFHAKKRAFVEQEIWAKLVMYNYCMMSMMTAAVKQKTSRKWHYQINFTMGFYMCMDAFRKSKPPPINEMNKFILPIRPDRKDKRKLKPKSAVGFIYRVI